MLWKSRKSSTGDQASSNTDVVASRSDQPSEKLEVTPENLDRSTSRPSGSFVVPKGYRISGTVVTARPVFILGELTGTSLTSPSVTVGSGGRLAAPVETNSLTVEGVVEQSATVRDGVEVRSGGAVLANLEASAISIAPGGVVSGARLAIGPLRAA